MTFDEGQSSKVEATGTMPLDQRHSPPLAGRAELLHHRQPQLERLARFGVRMSVDVHCHCLPGLDDGPETMSQSLALCRELVKDGITAVIATPHQFCDIDSEVDGAAIRNAVAALRVELARHAIPLDLYPGAEVRVDSELLERFRDSEVLTLADRGAYLLIELPHDQLVDLSPLIHRLVDHGVTPLLAHPERHLALAKSPQLLEPWLDAGARLQLTAGSLIGQFGNVAAQAAWHLLRLGWVSVVSSDAHDTVRRMPVLSNAIDVIASTFGHAVTRRLCVEHPQRVLEGRPLPRPAGARGRGSKAF